MYAFIEGKIEDIQPTYCVLNNNGIGYRLSISLYSFEKIKNLSSVRLQTQLIVREDVQELYGFFDSTEHGLFNSLISVSGIGPSIARMMLSSIPPTQVIQAIIEGNLSLLKSIKGVGPKSAQRLILELQDSFSKNMMLAIDTVQSSVENKLKEEAILAMIALGFNKSQAEKSISKALEQNKDNSIEELIKSALKLV
jgi:Holliday junction DNA helicase RuvA